MTLNDLNNIKFDQQLTYNPQDRCTQLVEDVQKRYGVVLTLRDRLGILRLPTGEPLFRQRSYHMHYYCRIERDLHSSFNRQCNAHCGLAVRRRCSKDAAPFVTNCWKGAREVVVPIWRNGHHAITIFAGAFRAADGQNKPREKDFSEAVRKSYLTLPEYDDQFGRELVRVLYALGQGIMHEADQLHINRGDSNDRKQQIRAFIFNFVHVQCKLQDLAQHLFLSPSRTSQVVRDIFGVSFQDLVIQERIERAKHLLSTTVQNQETIADRCGFSNPYYFSRLFKKITGTTPGAYRRQHKLE